MDDLGWQDTSVPFWKNKTPLNERYHTPNMERLAKQGMKFTQAYATPFPYILQQNNYKTVHVGKVHLGAIGSSF